MIPVRLAVGNHAAFPLCDLPIYLPAFFENSLISIHLFGHQTVFLTFNFVSEIRFLGVLLLRIDQTYSLGMVPGVRGREGMLRLLRLLR